MTGLSTPRADSGPGFVATLYKTYIREANDVVKLATREMSPHKDPKLSGGRNMLCGVGDLHSDVAGSA